MSTHSRRDAAFFYLALKTMSRIVALTWPYFCIDCFETISQLSLLLFVSLFSLLFIPLFQPHWNWILEEVNGGRLSDFGTPAILFSTSLFCTCLFTYSSHLTIIFSWNFLYLQRTILVEQPIVFLSNSDWIRCKWISQYARWNCNFHFTRRSVEPS